jgi:glycosyltransferase involved in cell wall biosynthesis
MRIAFYSPLKPASHPVPSGDREIARLFLRALRKAGHSVEVASRLRSYEGRGDGARQQGIRRAGEALAEKYIAKNSACPPDLWFTYHLYHKAPDWIGPAVARALRIPYAVAEASYAPKQADGPWATGHNAVANAVRSAACVICLNPVDAEAVRDLLGGEERIHHIAPFMDTGPAAKLAARRDILRASLAVELGIDPALPWIATTAMMRAGDKLASYRLLGQALRQVENRPWHLLVAGDGEARTDVERALGFPGRVCFLGRQDRKGIGRLHAAADIGAWPAINEAYGMALLEAQAAGLPMVAGDRPGVRQIVRHGETGILATEGDSNAFARALAQMLDNPDDIIEMRVKSINTMSGRHDLNQAVRSLDSILDQTLREAA